MPHWSYLIWALNKHRSASIDAVKCNLTGTAVDNTIGRLCQNFPFFFGQMTMLNGLIAFCPLRGGSFLGTPQISKSFKLPPFRFHVQIARAVETEKHLFLGKQIITLLSVVHIKLTPLSTSHPIASCSYLLIFPATFNLF
jgi:hypothetical protein